MANTDKAQATAPASTPKPMVVIWKHANHFEERELTVKDLQTLGASESATTLRWNASNDYRVPRSEIALDDAQLADLLSRDRNLVLEEA